VEEEDTEAEEEDTEVEEEDTNTKILILILILIPNSKYYITYYILLILIQ
jgi:hypothetical protein